MTEFAFENYQDWIKKNVHFYQCDVGSNSDININHIGLSGELLNHPRIFRNAGTVSKLNSKVESGGIESPITSNAAGAGPNSIEILHTERFKVQDEIYLEDNTGVSEIVTITSITENKYLNTNDALNNSYDIDEGYTVSTVRSFTMNEPETGTFELDDLVQLDTDEEYLIRKIIEEPDEPENGKVTIKCARITRDFDEDTIVSVLFPTNEITFDEDSPINDAIIIPEKTFPFNPQQFGIKAGSLHVLRLKDTEGDDVPYNVMTVESQSIVEFGSVNILFTTGDSDWSKFAQNLNFNNPMISPGLNVDSFDYSSDAEMQKIWKGSTTTLHSNTLKWTYSSNSLYALFPLPLDFVARSGKTNQMTFSLTGTGGNTGTLSIILTGADGNTFTYNYAGLLTSGTPAPVTIDFATFTGKQFVKKIEFRITSGSGILYLDDVTPFKAPDFDDIIGNPSGVVGTDSETGAIAIYYDVRRAPIHPLTANVSAYDTTTIQISLADTSGFTTGDKIVIYDLDHFEFAEVDSIDDGTHLTIVPLYGTFFYDYTTANYVSIQNLTYYQKKIAGAYSLPSLDPENDPLEAWIKTDIIIDLGDPGEWDEDSVSEPSVLRKFNETYIAYKGQSWQYPLTGETGIGFAYAKDFLNFDKLPDNPKIDDHDNPKIIDLNGMSGIICRDSSDDIKLFEDKNPFFDRLDFHVAILVRPVSSMFNPTSTNQVLYDQGNFRIELQANNTIILYTVFEEGEKDTGGDNDNKGINGWATELEKDHWNLIIAQTAGDNIGIARVGMFTYFPKEPPDDYFKKSPWKLNADLESGDTEIYIVRAAEDEDIPAPTDMVQSLLIWGPGYESDWTSYNNRQLLKIVSVDVHDAGPPIIYKLTLHDDHAIGPWGFLASWGDNDMGIQLAQGWDVPVDLSSTYEAFTESGDGEFSFTKLNRWEIVEKAIEGQQVLSKAAFQHPKIGSACDGTKSFTKGYIAYVDCSNNLIEFERFKDLELFADMITSMDWTNWERLRTPIEWWELDISAIGTPPTAEEGPQVARWNMDDYSSPKVPDTSKNTFDVYNIGATFDVDVGYGYGVKFDAGDYLINYRFGNLESLITLLSSEVAPSVVETPVSIIPQLTDSGAALISTIEGKIDYYKKTVDADPPLDKNGYVVLDLFESSTLPDSFDLDGEIYNPSNCSLKIYFAFKKNAQEPDWIEIEDETFDDEGFVTIDKTIDLTTYQSDDLLFYLRLRFEFITDGSDTTRIISITASATGYTLPPSDQFLHNWVSTNNFPCLDLQLIDDEGTTYNILDDESYLLTIPNTTFEIPIYFDQESNILPAEISFTFLNYNGFWNFNNLNSPLNGKNYLEFKIRILAGIGGEYLPQGIFKIEQILPNLAGTAEVKCSSELREVLDEVIGLETPKPFTSVLSAREFITQILRDDGKLPMEMVYFSDSLNDFSVSNLEINNQSIISVLRKICQAANYVAFINNQGEIRIINRADMDVEGNEYSNDYFITDERHDFAEGQEIQITNILTNDKKAQKISSAIRKNLIKRIKVIGVNNISAISENDDLTYGRSPTFTNNYIQQSADAEIIADRIIEDYGLSRNVLDIQVKYSPHLSLLDRIVVENPISGKTDTYMIMKINHVFPKSGTGTHDSITAILLGSE